ncbi:MAG: class I SAM-dependent methyltransferase [Bacteroidia bacterium]|nr:class I SAM-dependent methyltransferase [Bacteroidia bacterium]
MIESNNINEFNSDVNKNDGYLYTTNAKFSSIISNRRITKEISNNIKQESKKIIDIGCGDGTYTKELKLSHTEKTFFGFDPATDAINVAKNKYKDINFYSGNILDKKTFPDEVFDLGILRGVIHHISNPSQGIENSTYLANRIILVEPNGNNPILKLIEKKSKYHILHEEQSFTSKQLKKWISESGCKIVKLDYIGFVPFFFPTFLSKIIYFFQPLLERIYPLKKYFGAQIVIVFEKE